MVYTEILEATTAAPKLDFSISHWGTAAKERMACARQEHPMTGLQDQPIDVPGLFSRGCTNTRPLATFLFGAINCELMQGSSGGISFSNDAHLLTKGERTHFELPILVV
jgi:hypothetical protein